MKPVSPALQGRFLTTDNQGSPNLCHFKSPSFGLFLPKYYLLWLIQWFFVFTLLKVYSHIRYVSLRLFSSRLYFGNSDIGHMFACYHITSYLWWKVKSAVVRTSKPWAPQMPIRVFPGSPVWKTVLPKQGSWFWSLVRSHKPKGKR